MKICRYDNNKLGLVRGDQVLDVTGALEVLPQLSYPYPLADQLIANLDQVMAAIDRLAGGAAATPVADVKLLSPVANPSKIMGAPINYTKHQEEAIADDGIISDRPPSHISDWGIFLKANSAHSWCNRRACLQSLSPPVNSARHCARLRPPRVVSAR